MVVVSQPLSVTPKHLSFSSIQDWVRCPLLWYGRRVAKWDQQPSAPMALGRALHAAFEAHHQKRDAELTLLASWRDAVSVGSQVTFAQALSALQRYQRHNPQQINDRPEVRFNICIPGLDGVTLLGYLDLIRGSEFHEFKSCKSATTWTQERVDGELQATAYWWAYQQTRQREPRHAIYHSIPLDGSEPQRFPTYRTDAQIEQFLDLARRVYAEISSGEFLRPACTASRCGFPEQCSEFGGPVPGGRGGAAGGVLVDLAL